MSSIATNIDRPAQNHEEFFRRFRPVVQRFTGKSQTAGSGLVQNRRPGGRESLPSVLRPAQGLPLPSVWSTAKNDRRCDLIDKEIAGIISPNEQIELKALQAEAIEFRDRVAPLPIEGARAIHNELLNKKKKSKNPL
jgi:hypothetical protein